MAVSAGLADPEAAMAPGIGRVIRSVDDLPGRVGGAEVRWAKDEVDMWCDDWAKQRRMMIGIVELEPRDRLGKLRSTLGAVREERDGASQGVVSQSFPEVYTGTALLVHRAWTRMSRQWRPVINIHYVLREVKVKAKAAEINIPLALYWKYLEFGKSFVHSYVMVSTEFQSADRAVMETQKASAVAV
jgi:hypothetical protein